MSKDEKQNIKLDKVDDKTAYENLLIKYAELENENRLLGERCNQLLKDKGDLTDKIDDLKANFDYVLEGKEVEYREERKKLCDEFENMKAGLESQIVELKDHLAEEVELHLHAEDYIKSLEEEISVLLSCKNCLENKGGWICAKEYENKCLAQKIQHIKELQEENEELRNNGFTVSAMTEQQLKVAIEKGEQLEKENVEQKRRLDNLFNSDCWASEQLTKAKEIIKGLLPMASNFVFGTLPKLDEEVQLYRQAEQFLKEIEK